MSISERLKSVIHDKDLNIKGFSQITNIPYRSVQNYLLEDRDPNVDALVKMAATLNINLHWLITGKGEMFLDEVEVRQLTKEEIELLVSFKNCDQKTQRTISIAVNAISKKINL